MARVLLGLIIGLANGSVSAIAGVHRSRAFSACIWTVFFSFILLILSSSPLHHVESFTIMLMDCSCLVNSLGTHSRVSAMRMPIQVVQPSMRILHVSRLRSLARWP